MSLRRRTILLVAGILIGVNVIIYLLMSSLLMGDFLRIERDFLEADLLRVRNAFANVHEELSSKASDWAIWDDAWHYMQDRDSAFIKTNISDETFRHMRISIIAFYDPQGRRLFGGAYDIDAETPAAWPRGLDEWLAGHPDILGHRGETSTLVGTALLPDGALLLSSRPILRTNGHGPIRGSIVFGRFLTTSEKRRLAGLANLEVDFYRVDDPHLPDDLRPDRLPLSGARQEGEVPADERQITGVTTLLDHDSRPAILARVRTDRPIYEQGRRSLWSLFALVLLVNTGCGAVILVTLEHSLLGRIFRLNSEITGIGERGLDRDRSRVSEEGEDELTGLARSINRTLAVLEETQRDLSRARESAEAATRAKSTFLAHMSHELRTPLNAVIGSSDLLLASPLDAAQADYVRTMRQGARDLLALLNDILDFSKIESGRLDLEDATFNLHEVIRSGLELLAPSAAARRITLIRDLPPDLPPDLVGDPLRLRQILLNLVSNAIKFTPEGGEVSVSVATGVRSAQVATAAGSPASTIELILAVRDNGPGIDGETQRRLFQPFIQADSSVARRHGGSGLGLAIARRLAELMGGSLAVESEPGRGATFTARVRLRAAAPPGVAVPDPPVDAGPAEARSVATESLSALYPLKILVVEDQAVNRKVIGQMLARLGFAPSYAEDGSTAVQLCATGDFDLVFMDLRLPDMDGVAACRLIRASKAIARQPRIIALTAQVFEEDRRRTSEAGMDGFLAKPVSLHELQKAIVAAGRP